MKTLRQELEAKLETNAPSQTVDQQFNDFWNKIGSGISPRIGEELDQFVNTVAFIAFIDGYNCGVRDHCGKAASADGVLQNLE